MGTRFKLGGEGLREAYLNALSEFRVCVEGSGGDLQNRVVVVVRSPNGQPLPLDIYLVDGCNFYVQYIARDIGNFGVEVLFDGQRVVNQTVSGCFPNSMVSYLVFELLGDVINLHCSGWW
jgi:hypothetical protein